MSIFKVGDRVRVVKMPDHNPKTHRVKAGGSSIAGKEAIIETFHSGDRLCPVGILVVGGERWALTIDCLAPILPSPDLSEMTYAELMLSLNGQVTA